jgi:glucokinase
MILAGDIGGTNTRLAIFESRAAMLELRAEMVYRSREHTTLDEIVVAFVKEKALPVDRACFGIAGPVKGGRCITPNLAWVVDAKNLAQSLRLTEVFLLNDLESIAYGTAVLGPKDVAVLRAGVPVTGNRAVIAAGTGLGEAGLFWDGSRHRPLASEAGHADFAPRNELEIELLRYLIGRYQHVSYERILSGPGLVNVYEFFRDEKKEPEPDWLNEERAHRDAAAVITTAALAGKSPLCERTLDLFIQIYGAEAGNCALRFTAVQGVFVAGGVAPKILPKLSQPSFLEAFNDKGRLRPLLESIPVQVVTNDAVGLMGAAHFAASSVPAPLGASPV